MKFINDYGPMILEVERKATEEKPELKPEPSKSKTKPKKISIKVA